MALKVLRIGAAATFQDLGRPGWRRFGVPLGGAFDVESHSLANALLRNPTSAPTLEIDPAGGSFRTENHLTLSLVGADFKVKINDQPAAMQATLELHPGDTCEVTAPSVGARCYLAAPGGWQAERMLGSASGLPIKRGDTLLPASSSQGSAGARSLADPPSSLGSGAIRVLPGPQAELLNSDNLNQRWLVSSECSRMGVRLQGGFAPHQVELPSEPSCVGAVQVTPDGTPILLGPDGPTIGGYPKVAVVIRADLVRIGQLIPGMEVTFRIVSPDEAEREWRTQRLRLQRLVANLTVA